MVQRSVENATLFVEEDGLQLALYELDDPADFIEHFFPGEGVQMNMVIEAAGQFWFDILSQVLSSSPSEQRVAQTMFDCQFERIIHIYLYHTLFSHTLLALVFSNLYN